MDRRTFLKHLVSGAMTASLVCRQGLAQGQFETKRVSLRGQCAGQHHLAHSISWQNNRPEYEKIYLNEHWDTIIVGAGISGLSSAYFLKKKKPNERILLLDNHNDFGGHAKRVEFHYQGNLYLSYGGTQSFENPSEYGDVVKELLLDLGIDLSLCKQAYEHNFFKRHNLSGQTFFSSRYFHKSKLIDYDLHRLDFILPGLRSNHLDYAHFIQSTPLSHDEQKQWLHLWKDITQATEAFKAKINYTDFSQIRYFEFLQQKLGLRSEKIFRILQYLTADHLGLGMDVLSLKEVMDLGRGGFNEKNYTDPYYYHYPDGGATLTRALIKKLFPSVCEQPCNALALLNSTFRYEKLEGENEAMKLRLNSLVANIDQNEKGVQITYLRQGKSYQVQAKRVIMACQKSMIPWICKDLPFSVSKNMRDSTRIPLLYANVLIRHWEPLKKMGVGAAYCPGSFFHLLLMDFPQKFNNYQSIKSPKEPLVLTLVHVPLSSIFGLPPKEQFRQGRYQFLSQTVNFYEEIIVTQLDEMFSRSGFNSKRDIIEITVHPWAHGYAYEGCDLYDPPLNLQKQSITSSESYGNVHFANSDTLPEAYLSAAIDSAYRAVSKID